MHGRGRGVGAVSRRIFFTFSFSLFNSESGMWHVKLPENDVEFVLSRNESA